MVVDTGPIVALFDKDDREHAAALKFIRNSTDILVTSMAACSEVLFLLAWLVQVQTSFLVWSQEALDIDGDTAGDIQRMVEIMRQYADLPADFADASLVAPCERRGFERVATLDKHFDVYRTSARKRLRNVLRSG